MRRIVVTLPQGLTSFPKDSTNTSNLLILRGLVPIPLYRALHTVTLADLNLDEFIVRLSILLFGLTHDPKVERRVPCSFLDC